MKYRADFVTNSSSSSFVIAFKDFPRVPDELLADYPYLQAVQDFMKNLIEEDGGYGNTEPAEIVYNKLDLDNYILNRYDFNSHYDYETDEVTHSSINTVLGGDDYLKRMYDDCIKYLEQGYKVLVKEVDDCDDRVKDLVDSLLYSDLDFHLIQRGY